MPIWAIALVASVGGGLLLVVIAVFFVRQYVQGMRRVRPPRVSNGVGATNISANAANLRAYVEDHGNKNPYVVIHYGATDGGTNPDEWDKHADLGQCGVGDHSRRVTGLQAGETYYYRAYASNSAGESWAPASAQFTTRQAQPETVVEGDQVLAHLNRALAVLGQEGVADLELPEPEVEVPRHWAQALERNAEHLGERRQMSATRRIQLKTAVRVLQQLQRGVERERTDSASDVELTRTLNAIAEDLGLDPLRIISEEDQQAALNALRRANEEAEGMI